MSDETDSESFRRTDALRAVSETPEPQSRTETDRSRRGFLGRAIGAIAGAVAATVGVTRTGSARQSRAPATRARMRDLRRAYDAPAVEFAVERHATDLLADLATEELTDLPAADSLEVDELLGTAEYRERVADGDDAATVDAVSVDGELTAHATVSKTVSDGRVTFHVQPEVARGYAIYRPDDGQPRLLDGATTESLCTTQCSACSGCCTNVCFGGQVYEEVCCDRVCTIGEPCDDCC